MGCQVEISRAAAALRRYFSSNSLLPPSSLCPVPPRARGCLLTTQLSNRSCDLSPSPNASSGSFNRVTSSDGGGDDIVTLRLRHILKGLRNKQRASLAEAITLVESRHPLKHKQAQWLLSQVLAQRRKEEGLGRLRPTVRVGLSGPPGAGKSTLVETLGLRLVESGHKVAVLAVDPTSARTGGSILGDKTRMTRLAHHPCAYIRPSPTSGSLGGVTRSTNEAIVLCEGAGYDIVLVETVGVGQSETAVNDMVDVFLLVIPPAAGDELQGIKRGIVEVSDIIVINKADGDLLAAACRIKGEYTSAVKLSRSKSPHWKTQVLMASALHDEGIGELWSVVEQFVEAMRTPGVFGERRKMQRKLWMWNHIDWKLIHRFRSEPAMAEHIRKMEGEVLAGKVAPGTAADVLFERFLHMISF